MTQYKLTQQTIENIKSNPQLFAEIAIALDVSVHTLPALLRNNSPKLTQKNCLVIISNHLDTKETYLLQAIHTSKSFAA